MKQSYEFILMAIVLSISFFMFGFFVSKKTYSKKSYRFVQKLYTNRIRTNLVQVPEEFILLAGDSTISELFIPFVSIFPVLNIGIPGITIGDYLDFIQNNLNMRRPKLSVISIGTNDAINGTGGRLEFDHFESKLAHLVSLLRGRDETIVLSLPDVYVQDGIYKNFSNNLQEYNSKIIKIAAENNIKYMKYNDFIKSNGAATENATIDGLHLSGRGLSLFGQSLRKIMLDIMNR